LGSTPVAVPEQQNRATTFWPSYWLLHPQ
jgi:hypothetical protein